jgi:hypothetical protein
MSNKKGAKCPKRRKMTDCLKTRKPLTSKGFSYLFLWMIIDAFRRLFADTETGEDGAKNFFYIDDAGDGTQSLDCTADMKRH